MPENTLEVRGTEETHDRVDFAAFLEVIADLAFWIGVGGGYANQRGEKAAGGRTSDGKAFRRQAVFAMARAEEADGGLEIMGIGGKRCDGRES